MKWNQVFTRVSLSLIILFLGFSQIKINPAEAGETSSKILLPIVEKQTFSPFINFDNRPAPCVWDIAIALRNEYISWGVVFSGLQPLDGGALMNQCGNFFVTGYSAPNFLAFSKGGQFPDGGIATPPEIITFIDTVSYVSLKAGSYLGGSLTMSAYDALDHKLLTVGSTLSANMATVSVELPGIKYVIIDFSNTVLVIDDLSWIPEE